MRPCGVTQVISVNTRPAPPSARAPRCTRWKSLGMPSCALYVAIGETTTRLLEVHVAQFERQEHRRDGAVRGAAVGASGEPAFDTLEPRAVAQAQVLVADALAAGQQAVGELLRLEVGVARDVLEPLGRVARGGLQLAAPRRGARIRRRQARSGCRRRGGRSRRRDRWRLPARAWCRSRWRNARYARRRPSARCGP